jgi:hypothetical protein
MAAPKKKLAISCGNSDCGNGLHCFRVTARKMSEFATGTCQACGADPVDFGRVQERSLNDVEHTMAALGHEFIRNFFLKLPLGQKAKNYALRKGKKLLCETVAKRLKASIGPAQPFHDGWQTPIEEDAANPIWNAQHATATLPALRRILARDSARSGADTERNRLSQRTRDHICRTKIAGPVGGADQSSAHAVTIIQWPRTSTLMSFPTGIARPRSRSRRSSS